MNRLHVPTEILAANAPSPRVLFLDENIRDGGGHYLELASLLMDGARQLGYAPSLVTNRAFDPGTASIDGRIEALELSKRFDVRRTENWSLGVDGASVLPRDANGKPTEGSLLDRIRQLTRDRLCRLKKSPTTMIQNWSKAFVEAVKAFGPREDDRIVINTSNDFQLLALENALAQLGPSPCLTIDVGFHFAVYESTVTERAKRFGKQVNRSLQRMSPHHVSVFATTIGLAEQLRQVDVSANPIPYPTRMRAMPKRTLYRNLPKKIVLPGMIRAEKGKAKVKSILSQIQNDLLRSGKIQWSMQVAAKSLGQVIPSSLVDLKLRAIADPQFSGPLELHTGSLDSDVYHRWLDSADACLFLYDSRRYRVRCSGVLLEMLTRGIPVIVPDDTWLSEEVRRYSDHGDIGWIYQSIDQIPGILSSLDERYEEVAKDCRKNASRISAIHCGINSLRVMGLQDRSQPERLAAG